MNRFLFMILLFLFLLPSGARAQCENPHAAMGVIIFNKAHKVMQYCNGDKWIGLWGSGSGSGSEGDNVPIGAVMSFDLTSCPEGWSEYLPRADGSCAVSTTAQVSIRTEHARRDMCS